IKYIFEYHYELNDEMKAVGSKFNFDEKLLYENRVSMKNRLLKYIDNNNFEKETKSNLDIFSDLLEKMLCFNKDIRLNAHECLTHPFFNSFKIHIQKMMKMNLEDDKDTRLIIKYDEYRDMMSE